MNKTQERRSLVSPFELRKGSNGLRTIAGRGITYSTPNAPAFSNDLGGFKEQFLAGSTTVDESFRVLYNHDNGSLLGTLRSGTATTERRADGLYYTCQLPDTQLGRDVQTLIDRGDIGGSNTSVSFGFSVNPGGEKWSQQGTQVIRTISDAIIWEVSILGGSTAAYDSNTVILRGVPEKYRHLLKRDAQELDADDQNDDSDSDDSDLSDLCSDCTRCVRSCTRCSSLLDDDSDERAIRRARLLDLLIRQQF